MNRPFGQDELIVGQRYTMRDNQEDESHHWQCLVRGCKVDEKGSIRVGVSLKYEDVGIESEVDEVGFYVLTTCWCLPCQLRKSTETP